ncbi:MAG: metallophosphoesterase, partial [Deltaproteobacteria bacterium]
MMKKSFLPLLILIGLAALLVVIPANLPSFGKQLPYRLVVLGDPHLPGKFLPEKIAVIRTINAWSDVALVVAVGDICERFGTEKEYFAARHFFSRLKKPFIPIPGNHDFILKDNRGPGNKFTLGSAADRQKKLTRFQRTFKISQLYHRKQVENYQLIFLATDNLYSDQITCISPKQLQWLQAELQRHPKNPTIIFFHSPLYLTISNSYKTAYEDNNFAQPRKAIDEVLKKNPQVFLWVCGHIHLPATSKDFRADI